MNLSTFGIDGARRKTLVVLGAGATRGASFVNNTGPQKLPPLDKDFFQQMARTPLNKSVQRKADKLLKFTRDNFRTEVGLSMEEFLSEVEYTDQFHEEFNIDPGPKVKDYQKALENFHYVLPEMLKKSCGEECKFHNKLAENLYTHDCVVSFNYDCVIDRALKNHTLKRWDPDKNGYGFSISGGGEHWKNHSTGRKVENSIKLLKLHGSMNWKRKEGGDEIELVEDLDQVKNLKGSIIPPTWFKDLNQSPFKSIWKRAREKVRSARIIIVVGYSVPETDLFSKSLFKVEAGSKRKREKLDLLVLVNPDEQARGRFVNMVEEGLEPYTKILEFNTLSELYDLMLSNE